jgi:hypothetical protein
VIAIEISRAGAGTDVEAVTQLPMGELGEPESAFVVWAMAASPNRESGVALIPGNPRAANVAALAVLGGVTATVTTAGGGVAGAVAAMVTTAAAALRVTVSRMLLRLLARVLLVSGRLVGVVVEEDDDDDDDDDEVVVVVELRMAAAAFLFLLLTLCSGSVFSLRLSRAAVRFFRRERANCRTASAGGIRSIPVASMEGAD